MVSINNAINNTVGASNSGVTNTLTVQNPSDTASSQAQILSTVGGTSAGDTWLQLTVGSTTSIAVGLDNSDSDKLKINYSNSASVNPSSGTNLITCTVAGDVSLPAGNLSTSRANVGGSVTDTIANTDNTNGASNAALVLSAGGASGGDPYVYYEVSGVTTWVHGIDNSAADAWKLSASTSLGTTDVMIATTAGEITYPLQPAFMAYQASTATDVTGAGGAYTLGTTVDLTEVFDQGGDFDPATGTLTAPVTSRWDLAMSAYVIGTTIATTFVTQIVTSNQAFQTQILRAAVAADQNAPNNIFCDMDAADTATFLVSVAGEAGNSDDIFGQAGSPRFTWCSGKQVC